MNYDRIRATAIRLLDGAKQGAVTLTRVTVTPAANEYEDPTETEASEALTAIVKGVSASFIDNSSIVGSDREVICVPPDMGVKANDGVTIDGKDCTIIRATPIPAAGDPAVYRLIVR